MIDFGKLQSIIPEEGSLVLQFTKKDGKVTVCYAPKYKGKEDSNEFPPLLLTGTPEELNEGFEKEVGEIAGKEKELLALLNAPVRTVSAARKGSLDRKIEERRKAAANQSATTETKPAATEKTEEKGKGEKTAGEQGSIDNILANQVSLFDAPTPPPGKTETADVPRTGGESEAPLQKCAEM